MRKASVSAQLTRTARRFSTVIVPQLTKIDAISVLQKHSKLVIHIADVTHLQEAIKQFVLHNNRHFNPVEFQIRAPDVIPKSSSSNDPSVILVAHFYAEEIVLFEGTKRLLSICLNDNTFNSKFDSPSTNPFSLNHSFDASPPLSNSGGFGLILAKVRHPVSGIKVFEVVESTTHGATGASWTITGTMDELNKCRIETQSSVWLYMVSACGFSFSKGWWSVEHAGVRVGQITPQGSFFSENSICVEWSEEADNELRLLTLCFGVIQTIREAYPSLMHILHGNQKRKSIIA